MKNRWLWTWCAAGLVMAAMSWKLSARKPIPEQAALFGTGGKVVLKAVTFGTKHYPPGEPWRRLWALIPEVLRNKFKLPHPTLFKREVPSLACWFEWKDKPANVRMLDCVFVDENDVEAGSRGSAVFFSAQFARAIQ